MNLTEIKNLFRRLTRQKSISSNKEHVMKIQVGQPAPDFTLPSHLDKNVTLSHLQGKNVVLVFFPQAWTPI